MTFLLACLLSVGGALFGGLATLIIGAPIALIVFGVCAIPLAIMFIFHVLSSLDEKDLEEYKEELRRKEQEEKDKLYSQRWN